MEDAPRRRRRVRREPVAELEPAPEPVPSVAQVPEMTQVPAATQAPAMAQTLDALDTSPAWSAETSQAETNALERGLRGLVGSGSSQVSRAAAMRARDATRPRERDLARSEAELVVVRRYWTPRD
jgi:hypothetical protein